MVNVTVGFPGIQVIDSTTPTNIVSPYGVGIILGSANEGTIQALFPINSLEDFTDEFGTDSPSGKYITSYFANTSNNNVRLYFYRVNGETASVPDTPVIADYTDALDAIDPNFNPGGLIIAPEAFETLSDAERKILSDAMRDFCDYDTTGSLWFGIVDIKPTVVSINEAVTDKTNTFTAAKGQLFTYFPHYYNASDVLLLPSAAMMAIILNVWSSGSYQEVPAGLEYVIADCSRLAVNVKVTERSIAHTNNINLIRYFNNIGYAPDDSLTLSSSKEYYYINSVVCFRIVIYMLIIGMEPYVHDSISGNSAILLTAIGTVVRILQSALDSGYLTRQEGAPITDAYVIETVNAGLPEPGNSVLVIRCSVRPAYTLQKIAIYISNTLGVTTSVTA